MSTSWEYIRQNYMLSCLGLAAGATSLGGYELICIVDPLGPYGQGNSTYTTPNNTFNVIADEISASWYYRIPLQAPQEYTYFGFTGGQGNPNVAVGDTRYTYAVFDLVEPMSLASVTPLPLNTEWWLGYGNTLLCKVDGISNTSSRLSSVIIRVIGTPVITMVQPSLLPRINDSFSTYYSALYQLGLTGGLPPSVYTYNAIIHGNSDPNYEDIISTQGVGLTWKLDYNSNGYPIAVNAGAFTISVSIGHLNLFTATQVVQTLWNGYWKSTTLGRTVRCGNYYTERESISTGIPLLSSDFITT